MISASLKCLSSKQAADLLMLTVSEITEMHSVRS